ncbi:MAG: methyltransferase domain-containing protein [Lachnospiraceae bacterium]|nr:methyltransferase domain-containing protein [Lachnospiraceae bacterium]
MEEAYSFFSQIYDDFMEEVPYETWAAYLSGALSDYGIKDGLVCELGCGTGVFTRLLAARGYDMIGVDASEAMLEEARYEQAEVNDGILYLQQDMRSFELYGTVRAVVSVFDSINYITEPEDLVQVFKLVNNYLDPGGIFVFDFNTVERYRLTAKDGVIAENREDYTFIWDGAFDEATQLNEIELTLFFKTQDGTYEKVSEFHSQRGYTLPEMKKLIDASGLTYVKAVDAETHEVIEDPDKEGTNGRIYIFARECGK